MYIHRDINLKNIENNLVDVTKPWFVHSVWQIRPIGATSSREAFISALKITDRPSKGEPDERSASNNVSSLPDPR